MVGCENLVYYVDVLSVKGLLEKLGDHGLIAF
jgi:hypothetical protein